MTASDPGASRPKIAYLYSRFPVHTHTFVDMEILALIRNGVDLSVVSLNSSSETIRHEYLREIGERITFGAPPLMRKIWAKSPDFQKELGALIVEDEKKYPPQNKPKMRAINAWAAAKELKRRGIGHVHIHFANQATYTARFLKRLGISFSFTIHAQDFMVDMDRRLLKKLCHEATFVVTSCEYNLGLIQRWFPEIAQKCHRVYGGQDLARFEKGQPENSDGKFRIVSTGRLIEFKGFDLLIKACSILKSQGILFQCDLLGDGPLMNVLREQVALHGLEMEVKLHGKVPQSEVQAFLKNAHVFCLACREDQKGACDMLPTVITEAMATGIPVVSTKLVGIPEQVIHGETGFLADPENAEQLAHFLKILAENPSQRGAFGLAGVQHVQKRFNADQTAAEMMQLFRHYGVDLGEPTKEKQARGEKPRCLFLYDPKEFDLSLISQIEKSIQVSLGITWVSSKENWEGLSMEQIPQNENFEGDHAFIPSPWDLHGLCENAEAFQAILRCYLELGSDPASIQVDRWAKQAFWLLAQRKYLGFTHVHVCSPECIPLAWVLHAHAGISWSYSLSGHHEVFESRESQRWLKMLSTSELNFCLGEWNQDKITAWKTWLDAGAFFMAPEKETKSPWWSKFLPFQAKRVEPWKSLVDLCQKKARLHSQ